jgi:hypothetical protein
MTAILRLYGVSAPALLAAIVTFGAVFFAIVWACMPWIERAPKPEPKLVGFDRNGGALYR